MADEIERKFLVTGTGWREMAHSKPYVQGYLSRDPKRIVRIRVAGDKAFLTIKGATTGITRSEFEYAVPIRDASELLKLCVGPLIEKTRHVVTHAGKTWEIDEFHGDNEGLIVAELELASEDEPFDSPHWLGREVSDDPRYYNASLSEHPYREWKDQT